MTIWLIAIALLFPLFFQLSGGIYNNPAAVTDSLGVLSKLPLPISIIACLLGILALAKNYRQALPAAWFIGVFSALMLVSLLCAGADQPVAQRKVLIGLQFLLPTMGLVLGQLVRDEDDIIPRAFMWVLLAVVPFQILAGWWQKTLTLTHNLYVFSIYQHFQFVPVVFVLAFCLVMVHLWDNNKRTLSFLAVVMGVYAIASASFLAMGLYCVFVAAFFLRRMWQLKTGRLIGFALFGAGIFAAGLVVAIYYGIAEKNTSIIGDNGQYLGKFQTLVNGKVPVNVLDRLGDWKLYHDWITESDRTMLLGHVEPPPREVKTSAHNWYLDFVYNFGLLPLMPLLALIGYTAWQVVLHRKTLTGQTLWLAALVAFMVLVDSNFKVTLRQPYPGIFAFFLWGLLLTRLRLNAPPQRGG
ncbi:MULTISPECIES: hypothetical protein [unclassified Polaromonas]|uniref:hypothetical protein n=1 Tax=unclassified Polaromonas TaxID=2638319 RepID=UPI001E6005C3|nr:MULTISPECIES: hypothetical protein [unclassified Polaromonas]